MEAKLSAAGKENDQLILKSRLSENQLMQVNSQIAVMSEKNLLLSNSLKEVTSKEQDLKTQYAKLEERFTELNRYYQAGKFYLDF